MAGKMPFTPLSTFLEARFGPNKSDWARATGLDRSAIHKALKRGSRIQLDRAEMACDALGVHPTQIWPDYYELAGAA